MKHNWTQCPEACGSVHTIDPQLRYLKDVLMRLPTQKLSFLALSGAEFETLSVPLTCTLG